jgi:hypothetical protein
MVERDELELGCADGTLGVPGRFAATERLRPEERVDRALKPVEEGVPRPYVLPEAELAAGHQDAPQLLKRRGRVGDAAEDPITTAALKDSSPAGSASAKPSTTSIGPRRASGPFLRRYACRRVGLDGEDAVHGRRIELERAPVTGADFDDPAAQPFEQPPP